MGQVSQWLNEHGESPAWDWERLPTQKDFIVSPKTFTMYSGGFGTGKTYGLVAKVLGLMTGVPNNLGMLARQDGKALRQTTLLTLLEMIPKSWIAAHDSQKGVLKLHQAVGGSALIYGDLKDKGDLKNHNLGFFAVDPAEDMEWNSWQFLAGRLRRRTPIIDPETKLRQYLVEGGCQGQTHHYVKGANIKVCQQCGSDLPSFDERTNPNTGRPYWDMIIYPRFGFGVCNTEDPNHWIYEKFSNLPGPGNERSQGIEGYEAFSATTYDGMSAGFVDQAYVRGLELTYKNNPLMYDRYLLGKWVTAEGRVFPEFSKENHVYCPEEKRYDGEVLHPDWLPIHEYIDPGISATTAVGWVVVEHCNCGCGKPNFYVVDEHYVASPIPEYHCQQIKEKRSTLGRHVVSTEMDEQSFSKTNIQKLTTTNESRLYSLAQLYIEGGIFVRRNQKDWDSGHARLSAALAEDPNHINPFTGKQGAPHFFVSMNCRWFIKEILNYKWKKRKTDSQQTEEPVDKDDHHMDGIISFMAGRPEYRVTSPEQPDTRPEFQRQYEDELEMLTGFGKIDFMEM